MTPIEDSLQVAGYNKDEQGIFRSGNKGYWSNLDKEENQRFLDMLQKYPPREAVRIALPQFENIIFSEKREAALELLDIQPGEVCIDYGCMWGVLSVGMAKRGGRVVSIDQTGPSLTFLAHRRRHDKLDSLTIVQDDIKKVDLPELADCSVVNGVLEWIPETSEVDLKKFYGRRMVRSGPRVSPQMMQLDFLQRVHRNLKGGGRLLLAIENRYDYTQFIGKKDPHANLWFTSFLPRQLSSLLSYIQLGRPYVNYLYSFPSLHKLLLQAGFAEVELYMCFPNYRFPELILPYDGGLAQYRAIWPEGSTWRRKVALWIERFLMRVLKGRFFAPSIVAVARK